MPGSCSGYLSILVSIFKNWPSRMSRRQIIPDNTASVQADFNQFSEVSADCSFVRNVDFQAKCGNSHLSSQPWGCWGRIASWGQAGHLVSLCLPGLYNEPLPLKEKIFFLFFFFYFLKEKIFKIFLKKKDVLFVFIYLLFFFTRQFLYLWRLINKYTKSHRAGSWALPVSGLG